MYPGILLADIGMFVKKGVHLRPTDGTAKGQLMQGRSAGGNDDPVDAACFNIFLDEFLAGIGTHEHVGM